MRPVSGSASFNRSQSRPLVLFNRVQCLREDERTE